eukprot:scaffold163640_cov33-Tisochrysis_lutea.AAC.1
MRPGRQGLLCGRGFTQASLMPGLVESVVAAMEASVVNPWNILVFGQPCRYAFMGNRGVGM